jgi:hypothetical protein
MRIQVLEDESWREVDLSFGSEQDLKTVDHWRAPNSLKARVGVRDTIEFARLASKRWRYYRRSVQTATSMGELRRTTKGDPEAEVSFLLIARGEWFAHSSVLGLAQCRRTYCQRFILEFLSVHPAIVGGDVKVRGISSGLLFGLAEIATQAGINAIWGEATLRSAPFYAKVLRKRRILDQFFIGGKTLRFCRKQFLNSEVKS